MCSLKVYSNFIHTSFRIDKNVARINFLYRFESIKLSKQYKTIFYCLTLYKKQNCCCKCISRWIFVLQNHSEIYSRIWLATGCRIGYNLTSVFLSCILNPVSYPTYIGQIITDRDNPPTKKCRWPNEYKQPHARKLQHTLRHSVNYRFSRNTCNSYETNAQNPKLSRGVILCPTKRV